MLRGGDDQHTQLSTRCRRLMKASVVYIRSQHNHNYATIISLEQQSLVAFELNTTTSTPFIQWHLQFNDENTLDAETPVLTRPPKLIPFQPKEQVGVDGEKVQLTLLDDFKRNHCLRVFIIASVGKYSHSFTVDPKAHTPHLPVSLSRLPIHQIRPRDQITLNWWKIIRCCIDPKCKVDASIACLNPCMRCYFTWACTLHGELLTKHTNTCGKSAKVLDVSSSVLKNIVFTVAW
jgi:hypothetical protein